MSKCPTGIRGLDQITDGGLPRGRPTLVCGGAGSGKTLLGAEFLVNGARHYGEHGALITFEERAADVVVNTESLHFGLAGLVAQKKIAIEEIAIDRGDIIETGEYNLDGLFIRIGAAIDAVSAKRVVLDTVDVLFAALSNAGILRSELRRLFGWLKSRGVTALVTSERGDGAFTRHGLEEYVSDCVILLDQRVTEQVATRRLRVVKYRGSRHGTNEYPFLLDERGFTVLPITGIGLDYAASNAAVPSGVSSLDAMLARGGFLRGSTILVSGTAGTGKSSLAAHFAEAACRRGERCLYFAFEESAAQVQRNMRSIGLDLDRWMRRGRLQFHAARPSSLGLEAHIGTMLNRIEAFAPHVVVLDLVSSFEAAGTPLDARAMLMRLVDLLKSRGITALFTSLIGAELNTEQSGVGISSLIDTWILVRNLEQGGERTRALYVLKSRGMRHSNQVREMLITDHGVRLEPIMVGPDGVLVGSARAAQELRDKLAAATSHEELAQRREALARKHKALRARIAEMEADYAAEAQELAHALAGERVQQKALAAGRDALARQRGDGEARP